MRSPRNGPQPGHDEIRDQTAGSNLKLVPLRAT
jgi:hypothetical protein